MEEILQMKFSKYEGSVFDSWIEKYYLEYITKNYVDFDELGN